MRTGPVLLIVVFAASTLAGCLGGDEEVDSAIPRAVVSVTPVSGKVDTFLFDASGSTGRGLKYAWDFGDKQTSDKAKVEHAYEYGSGLYDAKLTITDASGITDVWEDEIQVGDGVNRPPIAFFTPETRYLLRNEAFTVDARATTDFEGDPIRYEWDFNHIISEADYLTFREAKMDADYEDAATVTVEEGGDETAKSGSDPVPTVPAAPTLADPTDLLSGNKDPGHDHGGGAPVVSLFNGFRTTTEPVFTLEEGFPDATRFYVRLVAFDIKNAAQEILSEEIWPVEVVDAKKAEFHSDELTGTFQLGSPRTIQETTPNNEEFAALFDDDLKWTFEIPDNIELMYVNVTWTQPPTESAMANDIDLEVETPNGKTRAVQEVDTSIVLEMTRYDELDTGTTGRTWGLDLVARAGYDIEYTVSYWAKVDLNPFRALEAPYVVDEPPRDGET